MIPGTGQRLGPPPETVLFVRLGLAVFAARRGVDLSGTLEAEYLAPGAMEAWDVLRAGLSARPGPSRLDRLADDFALEPADRHLVALLAAVEADWRIGAAVAALQAPDKDPRPTLHLAEALARILFSTVRPPLALLRGPMVGAGAVTVLGEGPAPYRRLAMPPAFAGILSEGPAAWPGTDPLTEEAPCERTAAALALLAPQLAAGEARYLLIRGPEAVGRAAAVALAERLSLTPLTVPEPAWRGEPALRLACRYGRMLPVVSLMLGPGERWSPPPLSRFVPAVYLAGGEGGVAEPGGIEVALDPPDRAERARLWSAFASPIEATRLAGAAALDAPTIRALGTAARLAAAREDGAVDAERVLRVRRALGAERLARLARPVTRPVPPEALILPAGLRRRLDRLIDRCRARETVHDGLAGWLGAARARGVHALFAGPSGAGKTLAASHLAERLSMPLWRLDLSAVMNKYIGETEKNLSAALDEAEALDVALLLDEADALFGRRGDGEGEGERYANMLTNFLLTRLEAHKGVTILTTNARGRMDQAFTRRLDFVLEFPLPGFDERLAIWRAHLGERAPDEADCRVLAAECELAGGFVRTAVLNAAAAVPGTGPIQLPTLAEAAVEEYRKLGRAAPATLARLAAHG